MSIRTVAASLVATLAVGCVSTDQFVRLPDQNRAVEDGSKARIYVVRCACAGGAMSMEVMDQFQRIGRTGPNGYLCWERTPGDTMLVGRSESISLLSLTMEAGAVYYVEQRIRLNYGNACNDLLLLSEEEGKKALAKCHPPQVVKLDKGGSYARMP